MPSRRAVAVMRVAKAIQKMGLRHAVITSVTRDDLPDGGAGHIAETVRTVRAKNPDTTIEVLVPDFVGDATAVETVLASQPDVFGHNIETVERLYPSVRGKRCTYRTALSVLERADEALYASKRGGRNCVTNAELLAQAAA